MQGRMFLGNRAITKFYRIPSPREEASSGGPPRNAVKRSGTIRRPTTGYRIR
jgi:hypothetical protein